MTTVLKKIGEGTWIFLIQLLVTIELKMFG